VRLLCEYTPLPGNVERHQWVNRFGRIKVKSNAAGNKFLSRPVLKPKTRGDRIVMPFRHRKGFIIKQQGSQVPTAIFDCVAGWSSHFYKKGGGNVDPGPSSQIIIISFNIMGSGLPPCGNLIL
jgi:hypothetical protein